MLKVQQINCPGCGSPWALDIKKCPYCGRPVIISSFDDVLSMEVNQVNQNIKTYLNDECKSDEIKTSLAMCYLRLKLFDKALDLFQQVMQNQALNSQIYFYSAVCLLGGKNQFWQKETL